MAAFSDKFIKILSKVVIKFISLIFVLTLIIYFMSSVRFYIQDNLVVLDLPLKKSIQKYLGKNYFIHDFKDTTSFFMSVERDSPFRIFRDILFWSQYDSNSSFAIESKEDGHDIKFLIFEQNHKFYSTWFALENKKPICFGGLKGWSFVIPNNSSPSIIILEGGFVLSILSNSDVKNNDEKLTTLIQEMISCDDRTAH